MELDNTLPAPIMSGENHRTIMSGLKHAKRQWLAARVRRNALLNVMEHCSVETLAYVRKDMEKALDDAHFWHGRVLNWEKVFRSYVMM